MAKGLAIPFRANKRGRAQTLSGSEYLAQVIRTGLTPCTSRNPFQRGGGIDIGIDERVVMNPNNAATEALARRGITRFFTRLRSSGLARLAPGNGISFSREEADLNADVLYYDLEADDEKQVSASLTQGLRSAPSGSISGGNT